MVKTNLNDCCYKCKQPDLQIIKSEYSCYDWEHYERKQVVECSHSKVCKYYIEEDEQKRKEQDDITRTT